MTHMTILDELKQQITLLASVEESNAPFISVYLNLEDKTTGWRETLDNCARILRRILKGDELTDLNEAVVMATLSSFIEHEEIESRSIAVSSGFTERESRWLHAGVEHGKSMRCNMFAIYETVPEQQHHPRW